MDVIFELVDPPEGNNVERAVAAIDYPWDRLTPWLNGRKVKVVWTDQQWDFWRPETATIEFGRFTTPDREPFVFAHEVGHLVDTATLTHAQRRDLLALLHTDPQTIGHYDHDHPDAKHRERWADNAGYTARINEAFADAFVAAFAPSLWDRHPRFVHWPADLAELRRVTCPEEDNVKRVKVTVPTNAAGNGERTTDHPWSAFLGTAVNSGYSDKAKHSRPIARHAAQDHGGKVRVEVQGGPANGGVDVFLLVKES